MRSIQSNQVMISKFFKLVTQILINVNYSVQKRNYALDGHLKPQKKEMLVILRTISLEKNLFGILIHLGELQEMFRCRMIYIYYQVTWRLNYEYLQIIRSLKSIGWTEGQSLQVFLLLLTKKQLEFNYFPPNKL